MNTERRGENFWRDSPANAVPFDFPDDVEATNEIPPCASRTFRPVFLAHRTSYWRATIAAIIATSVCAGLIGWFVAAALEKHS